MWTVVWVSAALVVAGVLITVATQGPCGENISPGSTREDYCNVAQDSGARFVFIALLPVTCLLIGLLSRRN